MIFRINGTSLNTKNIYKISKIETNLQNERVFYSLQYFTFDIYFRIHFFDVKEPFTVSFSTSKRLNNYSWYRKDNEDFTQGLISNDEILTEHMKTLALVEHVYNEIHKLWSNNQSEIPEFNF